MRFLVLLAALATLASPAVAHHSVAFYGDEIVELSGTLLDVQFINPHIRLTLEAQTANGSREVWRLEGNSPYNLRRAGVTPERLPIGEVVTVNGKVSPRQDRAMLATNLFLPDGEEVVLWTVRDQYNDEERIVDAATENRGIFRVWSVPAVNPTAGQIANQPFTDEAIAARSEWDMLDNFAIRCEPEGMPRIMVNPHPFEFVNRGSEILLRTELYDTERTIHMDREAPPADAPFSRLGYSIGRWENGDLIVNTTHLDWPYFDTIGTPLTGQAKISERFSLSEDQSRLDFDIVVTDPSTFTEPARLSGHWLALGETVPQYDCQPSSNR